MSEGRESERKGGDKVSMVGGIGAWHCHAIDGMVDGEGQAGQGHVCDAQGGLREGREEQVRLQSTVSNSVLILFDLCPQSV